MRKKSRTGFKLWLTVVALAVASAFFVPYFVMAALGPSILVYAFWSIFGFAVAFLIYWGVKGWVDSE